MLVLIAFASNADQPPSHATPTESTAAPGSSAPAPAVAQSPTTLSPELIYAALVAEVALQRGDYDAAFEHFLRAAELAREPSLAERAVRSALNAKRSAAARQALDLWTDLEPDAPQAHQLAAFLALEAGDQEWALASLERVIELAGVPGQGYLQAAQILGRLPDPADRLRVMRRLVDALDAQEDADAQFALATLAAAANQDEVAIQLAERAAKLRPGWSDPQLFLVRLLVRREQIEQAHAMLDRYLGEAPADPELKLMKAQLHMDAEEPEQALAVFDELLKRDPERPDVLMAAAVLALEIGDLDKARRFLEALQRLEERPNDVAFLLGQVEEQSGNSDAALALYEQVRGQNRTSAQVRIASLYAKAGEIARARELLQQLRDQSPGQDVTFYLIEGELLRAQGLDQQALDVYDRALAEQPAHVDLLYARAMLAVGMDKVGMLERDLRRILVDHPDHVDALNALGYTLADRTDRLDAAQAFIERALQLRPDDPAILDSMGWVLYRKGQAEDAEDYLRKALEQGFDAEIAAHLGEVLWSLGRKDEAREVWGHALDEAPEHEYLLRVLSRFRFSHTDH
ncbi:tetratricopeptide repeat protein [Halochromatium salexigens]|nr:tetratricopeptide repeat protein [Halochromatium salexigens]